MKIGTVCFSTDQGLGILAKSFYDHDIITHAAVILHGRRPDHPEWYRDPLVISDLRSRESIQQLTSFCLSMDVMIFFETPFVWELIDSCRAAKVPTILMPMHECMPRRLPANPDLFLCPSLLDLKWAKDYNRGEYGNGRTLDPVFLPVPVETPCEVCGGSGEGPPEFPDGCPECYRYSFQGPKWRQRTRAEVFVHNAGHGGLLGRNGTLELLRALPLVRSPIRLILRSQEPLEIVFDDTEEVYAQGYGGKTRRMTGKIGNVTVDYRCGTFPQETLWDEGDVFVFPEKFNGLSLPLQEARAAGMLVMGTDRFPMNDWLPKQVPVDCPDGLPGCEVLHLDSPLIPVTGYRQNRVSPRCGEFEEAIISTKDIAALIDRWYGKDITAISESGRVWSQENSWGALGPKYFDVLKRMVTR